MKLITLKEANLILKSIPTRTVGSRLLGYGVVAVVEKGVEKYHADKVRMVQKCLAYLKEDEHLGWLDIIIRDNWIRECLKDKKAFDDLPDSLVKFKVEYSQIPSDEDEQNNNEEPTPLDYVEETLISSDVPPTTKTITSQYDKLEVTFIGEVDFTDEIKQALDPSLKPFAETFIQKVNVDNYTTPENRVKIVEYISTIPGSDVSKCNILVDKYKAQIVKKEVTLETIYDMLTEIMNKLEIVNV